MFFLDTLNKRVKVDGRCEVLWMLLVNVVFDGVSGSVQIATVWTW
jgi:hypothetical protein